MPPIRHAGFVFVRSTLERRSRKAASGSGGGGKGFGAASQKQQADAGARDGMLCRAGPEPAVQQLPWAAQHAAASRSGGPLLSCSCYSPALRPLPCCAGTSLSVNPQLLLQEWSAAYIPGAALGGTGGLFSAAGEGGSLSLLPDSGGLLAQETGVGGGGGQPLPPAAQGADAATAGAADAAALDELRRVLRGQDLSQLYGYIGLPPPGAPSGSASSEEHQQQGQEEGQEEQQEQHPAVGGIRAYEPEAGELVVLLAARIGGKPATGAELLVAVRQPDGSIALELPDGWEAALAGAA